jgi:hypothetical protein
VIITAAHASRRSHNSSPEHALERFAYQLGQA